MNIVSFEVSSVSIQKNTLMPGSVVRRVLFSLGRKGEGGLQSLLEYLISSPMNNNSSLGSKNLDL